MKSFFYYSTALLLLPSSTTGYSSVTFEERDVDDAFPSLSPTESPTTFPTAFPTLPPTVAPSVAPSVAPTKSPTVAPTKSPTVAPTKSPTVAPTKTKSPTVAPFTPLPPVVIEPCQLDNGEYGKITNTDTTKIGIQYEYEFEYNNTEAKPEYIVERIEIELGKALIAKIFEECPPARRNLSSSSSTMMLRRILRKDEKVKGHQDIKQFRGSPADELLPLPDGKKGNKRRVKGGLGVTISNEGNYTEIGQSLSESVESVLSSGSLTSKIDGLSSITYIFSIYNPTSTQANSAIDLAEFAILSCVAGSVGALIAYMIMGTRIQKWRDNRKRARHNHEPLEDDAEWEEENYSL